MKLSRLVLLMFAGSVLATALVVPNAAAQCATGSVGKASLSALSVTVSDQPIRPITDQKTFPGTVKYQWDAGHSVNPIIVTIQATSKEGYGVIEARPQSYAVSVPTQPDATSTTAGGSEVVPFNLVVKFTREAPAFKDSQFTVTVNAASGTCIQAPEKAETFSFNVKPDFYSIISANADKAIIKAGQNNEKVIPVNVENSGNGAIKVFFEITGGDKSSKGMKVVTPGVETLDSPYSGGKATKKQIPISINTPYKNGYMNVKDTIDVKITSRSVDKTELEGDQAQLSILVSTQGVYVPGFDSVLMLGALAAAAGLVGMSRRKKAE